ncbi:MAG: DUF4202 domain-containing protein [Rubritalea sp.]|uniref:DUF4202 domain-containing protein n=1 Tax=Rubritalea sp. TaxID=2109375 RepID=UPI0032424D07
MQDSLRFETAIEIFDTTNAQDPRIWEVGGIAHPQELWFSERHTEWVKKLKPDASEALLLASRCQHICRWEVPRTTYPMGRPGYLKWRSDLKLFHADKAGELLKEVGYDDEIIARVQQLNLKKNLSTDSECQTLEDALCLTFMQYQFDDLIADTEERKMIKIVQKTWGKMSEQGHTEALKLDFSEESLAIVQKALE